MNTSITVSEKPPDTEAEAKSGRSPRDTSTSMEKKTISSPAAIGKNEAAALLAQIAQPQVINPALQNNVQKIPQNSKIMVGVRPELKKALELMRNLKFHEAILSLRSYIIPLCGDENGDLKSTSKGNEAERAAQALESLSKIPSNLASEKHLLLAICYLMRDQHQNAFTCFKKCHGAMNVNKNEKALFWYSLGLLYFENNSHASAEAAFRACEDTKCKFLNQSELRFRIAMSCKHLQKFSEAKKVLEGLVKNPPLPLASEDILFHIGHIEQLSGLHQQALQIYNRILKINPKHATTLRQMAWLLISENKKDTLSEEDYYSVLKYLDKALYCCPNDPRTLYVYCRSHLAMQNYNKAYTAIKKALTLDPMNPTYWFFFGVACFERNLYMKALNAYLRVVHLLPSFPNIWVNVAKLYQLYNQTEDALLAYQQAQKFSDNPQIANQILWLRKQLEIMKLSGKNNPKMIGGRVPSLKPMSAISSEINPRSFDNTKSRTWMQQDRGAKRKGLSRSGKPSNTRQGNDTKKSVPGHRKNVGTTPVNSASFPLVRAYGGTGYKEMHLFPLRHNLSSEAVSGRSTGQKPVS
mmetsp:Transcript_25876/g.36152  ORF Transcript_25876/g.36152 Transcript_25876/m.36152 type:complete len:581 (-) Transcript_25876:337-2079(-)